MWRLSSTRVEDAAPFRTGAVMVEGMVGGSNGGKEGGKERRGRKEGMVWGKREGGREGGMDRQKSNYISILLRRDWLTWKYKHQLYY